MDIRPYDFGSNPIRIIVRKDGTLEWVAMDVCNALGIKNSRQSVSYLDDDEKSTVRLSDSGPRRNTVLEPGLYRLISRSKSKTAKRFQRWIYHDVLPTIRKTGSYSIRPKIEAPKAPAQQIPRAPKTYKEVVQHLLVQIDENEKLIAINTDW